jgi:hypothetical protein
MWFWNLILKSRQHGFTTLIDIIGLDQALFNDNWSTGICAHTREDVERIFEKKVRFPYDCLPGGLKTARNADTESAKKLKFSNGSGIEVGTSLRSGTYQFVHVSEFGKICARYPEKAKEIVTGTFETVHPGSYLFVESTAEGRDGSFYRLVTDAQKMAAEKRRPNKLQFKLHFYAWFIDESNRLPAKSVLVPDRLKQYFTQLEKDLGILLDAEQRAWYAAKEAILGFEIKQEHPSTVEEAFEIATEGAYLAKQMSFLRGQGRITAVPHDPAVPVNAGWDFGISDLMCIWFHQYVGAQHRIIDYMTGADDDVLYYWREMQKKPYVWGNLFLPHDGNTRRIGSAKSALEKPRTIKQILEDAGAKSVICVPKIEDKYVAINETRLFLPKVFIDNESCEEGIRCLDDFKRDWDDKAGTWKNRPCHNAAMHGYDAFETLARGITMSASKSGTATDATTPARTRSSWR